MMEKLVLRTLRGLLDQTLESPNSDAISCRVGYMQTFSFGLKIGLLSLEIVIS